MDQKVEYKSFPTPIPVDRKPSYARGAAVVRPGDGPVSLLAFSNGSFAAGAGRAEHNFCFGSNWLFG